jgi:hypothetical protein
LNHLLQWLLSYWLVPVAQPVLPKVLLAQPVLPKAQQQVAAVLEEW